MKESELCMSTKKHYDISVDDQIRLFKQVGFDGFFVEWEDEETIKRFCKLSEELNLYFQSVHGPYTGAKAIWGPEPAATAAMEEIQKCVTACGRLGIPMVVLHGYYKFDLCDGPTQSGIEHFRTIVEEAAKYNMKIAFENLEGEEYLAALLESFKDYDNVGFCWDTGHEFAYSRTDFMALYGDRLMGTHLNDNLGCTTPDGKPDSKDDLHLMPFDGAINWESVAKKLKAAMADSPVFDHCLTFELKKIVKFNQFQKPEYAEMSMEAYFKEAYERANHLTSLF